MPVESTHNETEIISRIAAGDESAFTLLFNAYKDKLYSFILHLSNSAAMAEDVVQEVFLKIWRSRYELPPIDNVNAYLYRMAQNHAINGLRRQSHEALIMAEIARRPVDAANSEDSLSAKELQDVLQRAIASLPAQQRKVYELSREQGLTYEQIATTLDISASTVRNHMVQALKTIRQFIIDTYPAGLVYCILLLA